MNPIHDSIPPNDDAATGIGLIEIFRFLIGLLLLGIGVWLSLHVTMLATGLIRGDEQVGLLDRVVAEAKEIADQPKAEDITPIDLSADMKQLIVYGITFLLLLIPASVAVSLLSGGVRLLQPDTAAVLRQIADRMKSPDSRL